MKQESISQKDGKSRRVRMNRRLAIRTECMNCCVEDPLEVWDCLDDGCPLHRFRLGDNADDPQERAVSISWYCDDCTGAGIDCGIPSCLFHSFRWYWYDPNPDQNPQ